MNAYDSVVLARLSDPRSCVRSLRPVPVEKLSEELVVGFFRSAERVSRRLEAHGAWVSPTKLFVEMLLGVGVVLVEQVSPGADPSAGADGAPPVL